MCANFQGPLYMRTDGVFDLTTRSLNSGYVNSIYQVIIIVITTLCINRNTIYNNNCINRIQRGGAFCRETSGQRRSGRLFVPHAQTLLRIQSRCHRVVIRWDVRVTQGELLQLVLLQLEPLERHHSLEHVRRQLQQRVGRQVQVFQAVEVFENSLRQNFDFVVVEMQQDQVSRRLEQHLRQLFDVVHRHVPRHTVVFEQIRYFTAAYRCRDAVAGFPRRTFWRENLAGVRKKSLGRPCAKSSETLVNATRGFSQR